MNRQSSNSSIKHSRFVSIAKTFKAGITAGDFSRMSDMKNTRAAFGVSNPSQKLMGET